MSAQRFSSLASPGSGFDPLSNGQSPIREFLFERKFFWRRKTRLHISPRRDKREDRRNCLYFGRLERIADFDTCGFVRV